MRTRDSFDSAEGRHGRARLLPFLLTIVLLPCVSAVGATPYSWATADTDGNWSDSAKWNPNGIPGADSNDTVSLPAPSIVRYVTLDMTTAVASLGMDSSANNRLVMNGDLAADRIPGTGINNDWCGLGQIEVNDHTLYMNWSDNAKPIHQCLGYGTIVKQGTNTLIVGACSGYGPGYLYPFQGRWEVREGTIFLQFGDLQRASNFVLQGGATLDITHSSAQPPTNMTIAGSGYGNSGALRGSTRTMTASVVIASNATIWSSGDFTLAGPVSGPGSLTLAGTGTGTFNRIDYALSNTVTVAGGATLNVEGRLPNVTSIVIESGATLIGLTNQFINASVVSNAGASWVQNANGLWIGSGETNDGGSWSVPANWSSLVVPTNIVSLLAPSNVRTVLVDQVATVNSLRMGHDANDRILLDADLTVRTLEGSNPDLNWCGFSRIYAPAGRTLTVFQSGANGRAAHQVWGGGTLLKEGAGQLNVGAVSGVGPGSYTFPFDGVWVLNGGKVRLHYGDLQRATNMTVNSGAQLWVENTFSVPPPRVAISGDGPDTNGAIRMDPSVLYAGAITVSNDASILVTPGQTWTHRGILDGPGILTLRGGTFVFDQNNYAYSNKIVVASGCRLDVDGKLPNVTNITIRNGAELVAAPIQVPEADVVVEPGGVWTQPPANGTWTGPAGSNDAGNWSVTTNWSAEVVPTNYATITAPASARTVTVDQAASVGWLDMDHDSLNRLSLAADFNAGIVVGHNTDLNWCNFAEIHLNGHTLTMRGSYDDKAMNRVFGAGTIVKEGTNQLNVGVGGAGPGTYTLGFDGLWQLNGGAVKLQYGDLRRTTNMVVAAGATLKFANQFCVLPQALSLAGGGFGENGALWMNGAFSLTDTTDMFLSSNTTFCLDNAGAVWTHAGGLDGPGNLTLKGPGRFILPRTDYAYAGAIVLTNGVTLDVDGKLQNATNITIESGCTLSGLSSQFPNATVVNHGGTWEQLSDATWVGPSGNNDAGNWSAAANWLPAIDPTNQAILPNPPAVRTVTADVTVAVGTLTMGSSPSNRLALAADMTAGDLDGGSSDINWCGAGRLDLGGRTLFVRQTGGGSYPGMVLEGSGTVVKEGVGTFRTGVSPLPEGGYDIAAPFTGNWLVSNGTFSLNYCRLTNSASMTVSSGATLQVASGTPVGIPGVLTLSGQGYAFNGALYAPAATPVSEPFAGRVVVASGGATVKIASGGKLVLGGDLEGPGLLTLTGAGNLTLSNAWNFGVNGGAASRINVIDGRVDVSNCTLNISNLISATAREYVVVGYTPPGGNYIGRFCATNGLRVTWAISYAGTLKYPNAIVLLNTQPPGTVLVVH